MKQKLLSFFMLCILLTGFVHAQERRISGKVTAENGEPFPGVSVLVTGANVGTQTDGNGNYSLNVPAGASSLMFRFIGYEPQTLPIGDQSVINVQLVASASELSEVVVTANSIRREKRTLGYSAPTISNEELTEGRNPSFINSMAGKVAGVNITSTSNTPGSSSRIVLRGGSSISGNNQALIVIDGVPIDNTSTIGGAASTSQQGASTLSSVDFGNRGNDINPDDIASMTVLKGPAAAALYGSRASNGAVIITTKSGQKGAKTSVTFSTSNTFSSILKLPDLQNEYGQGYPNQDRDGNYILDADGNMTYVNDPMENWSWGAPFTGEEQEWGQSIEGKRLTKPYSAVKNNIRDFFKTGIASDNNLSFAGGGEKTTFYLGLNSLNSNGIIPGNKDVYNKYGVRFNGTSEFSNNFYAGVNFNYNKINANQIGGGQGDNSIYNNVLQTPRDIPLTSLKDLNNPYYGYGYTDPTGVHHDDVYGYYGAYTMNPYWILQNYDNFDDVSRVTGNFNVGYKPVEWLDIKERVGIDTYSDRRRTQAPKFSFSPLDDAGNYVGNHVSPGAYQIAQYNVTEVVHDFMVTATHQFNEDFQGSLMVGNNIRQRSTTSNITSTNASGGLVVPGWYNLANSNGPVDVMLDNWGRRRLVGVYGDLNLSYKDMVYLEATARNDWSSTLPKANNSFFYPSVSGSFVFSELFRDKAFGKVLSYGKLRSSWAKVGNDTDPYQLLTTFSKGTVNGSFGSTVFPFGNVTALMAGNVLGNAGLKPETTTSFEIGTEMGFFDNRISLDFSYYENNSKNQILNIPIPNSTGYGFNLVNAGKIRNRGVELALRGTPIKTSYGLTWELYGTFTKNNSKVIELMPGVDQISVASGAGFSGMSIVAAVGRPYGEFYGVTNATDDQGRTIVDSETGLPVQTSEAQYLGSYNPKYQASLGTNIRYKNWSLNALFDTKHGGKFFSRTRDIMGFNGTSAETGGQRFGAIFPNSVYLDADGNSVVNNSVTYNKVEYYPNIAPGVSVLDGSFIKLRTLAVTYQFTKEQLGNSPFGGLSIGLYGNNLFLWTPKENQFADPEINSAGAGNAQGFDFTAQPSVRNYGINVRVTF